MKSVHFSSLFGKNYGFIGDPRVVLEQDSCGDGIDECNHHRVNARFFFSSLFLLSCLGCSIRLGLEKWRFPGEIYKFSVHLTFAGDTRKGFEFEEKEKRMNDLPAIQVSPHTHRPPRSLMLDVSSELPSSKLASEEKKKRRADPRDPAFPKLLKDG